MTAARALGVLGAAVVHAVLLVALWTALGGTPAVVTGRDTGSTAVVVVAVVAAVVAVAAVVLAVVAAPPSGRPRAVLAALAATGAAAVALVADLGTVMVMTGAGTGDPLDPWRAAGGVLSTPYTWLAAGVAVAVGAAATAALARTR